MNEVDEDALLRSLLPPTLGRFASSLASMAHALGRLAIDQSDDARAFVKVSLANLMAPTFHAPLSSTLQEQMKRLLLGMDDLNNQQLAIVADEVVRNLLHELNSQVFMFVPSILAGFYDQQDLFGADVGSRFPKANQHIREAGNCLALRRSTAAAYHLMCVLEVGLDSLAFALGLPPSQDNWNKILGLIEAAIKAIDKTTHGATWKEDKEFYSGAALEFRFFKDVWRNHVAHARAIYTEETAFKVFEHVKAFMVHLATRLQGRP